VHRLLIVNGNNNGRYYNKLFSFSRWFSDTKKSKQLSNFPTVIQLLCSSQLKLFHQQITKVIRVHSIRFKHSSNLSSSGNPSKPNLG